MSYDTVTGAVCARFADVRERPALLYRGEDGAWLTMSYGALEEQVGRLARGLMALGVKRGERVAIVAETSPRWTLVDLAIACAGAVIVPLHHDSSQAEYDHVLAHSGARMAIVQGAEQLAKARRSSLAADDLELFLTLAAAPETDALSFDDACALGDSTDCAAPQIEGDDLFTIVYTSGTTGLAKGCAHTHAGYAAALAATGIRQPLGAEERSYLYLPLAHVFGREVQYLTLSAGACIAYFGGDRSRVFDEMQELRPTFFAAVPRLYERAHTQARELLEASGELPDEAELAAAVNARMGGRQPDERLEHGSFRTVRELFGGALRAAWSGAAPIEPDVLRFLFACGVPVYEGYGLTETAAAVTLGAARAVKLGACGRPLPDVGVRVSDDGEVQVRGAQVFHGYLDDPDATSAVLDGDWFRTGDLGSLDTDGFLTIVGRRKDIIVTANGKNVSPAEWESELCACSHVEQAVLVGDRRPYLIALLVLDCPGALRDGARTEVEAHIAAAVRVANAARPAWAQVKRFAILEHPFSALTGELTRSGKLRREAIAEMHRDVIAELYRLTGTH